MKAPANFVMDCEDEIRMLRMSIGHFDFPTVDWDSFLSQLFYALIELDHQGHELLYEFANEAAYNDLVFEHNSLTVREKEQARVAIVQAGLAIKEKLMDLGAYASGVFPYKLKAALDDGCLLFSQNEPDPYSAVPDFGYGRPAA